MPKLARSRRAGSRKSDAEVFVAEGFIMEFAAPGTALDRNLVEAIDRVLRGGNGPTRKAFQVRALNALARLASSLDEEALGHAAAAPSDYAALVRALGQPEALASMEQEDRLLHARLRGLEARRQILDAEGGALSAEEAGKQLGLTRQAVDKRRRAGRLLALSIGRRGYVYPAWQFAREGVLPSLELVLSDLGVRDPWMQAAFFLTGDPRLGGETPLEELRRGNVEAVRRAARGYGEHFAA